MENLLPGILFDVLGRLRISSSSSEQHCSISFLRKVVGYRRNVSCPVVDDLKKQEGVRRVPGLRTRRDKANATAAIAADRGL
jgi:hypothetical protein